MVEPPHLVVLQDSRGYRSVTGVQNRRHTDERGVFWESALRATDFGPRSGASALGRLAGPVLEVSRGFSGLNFIRL